MELVIGQQNGKTVITVEDERVDAHNSSELKDQILKVLEGGAHSLIVDLIHAIEGAYKYRKE